MALRPQLCQADQNVSFSKGDRVEVLDCQSRWYLGTIFAIRYLYGVHSASVRFDAWAPQFDEWIPISPSKIRIIQPKSEILAYSEKVNSAQISNSSSTEMHISKNSAGCEGPNGVKSGSGNNTGVTNEGMAKKKIDSTADDQVSSSKKQT